MTRIDTGQKWLGAVPSTWHLAPLGSIFQERKETVSDTEFPALSVTKNGVVPQLEDVAKTVNNDSRKLVRSGDFVINSRSDRKGSSGVSTIDGSVSVIYTVLQPRDMIDVRFAHHLLRSTAFQEEYYRWGNGIVADLWATRFSSMKQILTALPPLSEQKAIADHLDRETKRIDELIAEQRGLIETLRERRRAVIDDSLDGSGEWEVVPLKHLIERVEQGVSPQAGSVPAHGEEWGVLKSGCVNRGVFRESENKRLPEDFGIDESLAVRVGDVLVSRASGSVDFVGSCARVRSLGCKLILSDKIFRLVPRQRVDAGFLVWLLNSRLYREQVRLAVSGAQGLANNLPLSSLRTFAFHVPVNVDEQREIATNLDDQTSRIDTLIAESEDLIALSLERRAALITAAVTGQIDVRTAV